MQQSPEFTLLSTTLLVEVDVAPELADIHSEFAPLLRLSGICAVPSVTSVATSGVVSTNNLSDSDEEEPRGRRSPAMSPVRAAESKLAELTAPVSVTLPPPMSSEDAAFIAHYVQCFRAKEEAEKAYIAFIFQEYKKRKGIEQKRWNEIGAMQRELELLRQRELPPEVREAVEELIKSESVARDAVWTAYDRFLEWIAITTPQWIEAAQRQEQARLIDEKAKKAAMAAAREALAQELAMGKQLGESSNGGSGGGRGGTAAARSRASPSAAAGGDAAAAVAVAAVVNEDGTLSYEPTVSVDQHLEASQDPTATLGESELRRKAIRMLEAEEEEMRRRREEQVHLLRVQEEQLRAQIELKKQHEAEMAAREEREAARKHEDELAQRYNALLEQEFNLQSRVREREEQEAKKKEERRMLMEHVAAEEQLLRQRIQEKEERRKASEEETARVARERQMREIREQEEALRRRIAERDAAEEARRKAEEDRVRREAEAAAVRAEQDEALRRAKAEQERSEKMRQLAYLRDQEEAYKRHIREKELAEIEAKRRATEAHWTHPALPYSPKNNRPPSSAPPVPTASIAIPTPHAAQSFQVSYYPTPQPPAPPTASYLPAAAPPVMPSYYGFYGAPSPVPPPPPQQPYAFSPPYAAYPVMPPPQHPMMMQGYPPNPHYPQAAPPSTMPLQSSPYAPTATYPH
ncbi:hypothetical protein ABL78_5777 [Leptomonas seymouri]|uniref:Uncharacterized protein n=1 Tax=Leptomonas seymouri TaxID=5684 RepID=A0A0N1HUL8_LEPSE|nr:hypothetical protein ABL78_5777 [Leptomonas seymouri]|eukprot:KPI85152.1 hypothetical protein ABL78_5777 [Leptomonas seymouri]